MEKKISVVILTSRGPRHSYFCRRLAEAFDVRGIVVDDRYGFRHRLQMFLKAYASNPFNMVRKIILKNKLRPYEERDEKTEREFFQEPVEFPAGIPVRLSRDPNDGETQSWIRDLAPDVLAVFGTRIIRAPTLSLARFGALNMHTGLSPYYRGGQCTFWCLYQGDLEHVGVTIHHLSPRIDGGDIVYTARPEIEPHDTVRRIECKLVQIGTEKMIQAVSELAEGRAPRIPQMEKGQLFLSKMFTLEKRLELEHRLDTGWLGRELERRGVPSL